MSQISWVAMDSAIAVRLPVIDWLADAWTSYPVEAGVTTGLLYALCSLTSQLLRIQDSRLRTLTLQGTIGCTTEPHDRNVRCDRSVISPRKSYKVTGSQHPCAVDRLAAEHQPFTVICHSILGHIKWALDKIQCAPVTAQLWHNSGYARSS